MRRAQKQQVEELISQMEKAHEQICVYVEQGDVLSARNFWRTARQAGLLSAL